MFDRLRRLMDSPLGAVLGGACYGSWAGFANWSAGAHAALRIAFIHFLMSSGLTLAGVAIMNRLFRIARRPRHGAAIAFCGSMTFTYALLIGVHTLIDTPHILLTLAPGFIPTVSFCVVYPLLLLRHAQAVDAAPETETETDALEVDDEVAPLLR